MGDGGHKMAQCHQAGLTQTAKIGEATRDRQGRIWLYDGSHQDPTIQKHLKCMIR